MIKLIQFMLGYKVIDIVTAPWEVSCMTFRGEPKFLEDYSIFTIYYNEKKDRYKIIPSGYKPFEHELYTALSGIIGLLNCEEDEDGVRETMTSYDYFMQKSLVMKEFYAGSVKDNKASVYKLDLNDYKKVENLIINNDTYLIKIMQDYKRDCILNTDIEIFEDRGNVIITSEGCFFSSYEALDENILDDE